MPLEEDEFPPPLRTEPDPDIQLRAEKLSTWYEHVRRVWEDSESSGPEPISPGTLQLYQQVLSSYRFGKELLYTLDIPGAPSKLPIFAVIDPGAYSTSCPHEWRP